MQNLITATAILALIAGGVVLISLLGGRHDGWSTAPHSGRFLPGRHGRTGARDHGPSAGGRQ